MNIFVVGVYCTIKYLKVQRSNGIVINVKVALSGLSDSSYAYTSETILMECGIELRKKLKSSSGNMGTKFIAINF
jgi:hypothetical protein